MFIFCGYKYDTAGTERHKALMMEAARTSETLVDIELRTRQYIPEDSELHTRRRENLKSHKFETSLNSRCT
jgi:hypothetical protein